MIAAYIVTFDFSNKNVLKSTGILDDISTVTIRIDSKPYSPNRPGELFQVG